MRASIAALLAAATVASAQTNAPVVATNPVGASYLAVLPNQEKYTVRGSIAGTSANDGKGVNFQVAISGLPSEGGPFMYHIHEKPVPADGNCTGTGAHLDPYKRGEVPICDASKPETCQTGDLSGKFGNITENGASAGYLDLYTSTDPSNPSYFGNLSVVVHLSNKTRISCANFTVISPGVSSLPGGASASSGYALPTGSINANSSYTAPTASGTGTGSATKTPTGAPTFSSAAPTQPSAPGSTGAADKLTVAGIGALAGFFALFL